jgi:CSLREA domain-containing protein
LAGKRGRSLTLEEDMDMARLLGMLVLAASLLGGGEASASTLTVNSPADDLTPGDGQCTLREAVLNANADADLTGGDCAAGGGADEIHVPAGNYVLSLNGTAGSLALTDDATLLGAGADRTIIDAGGVGATLAVSGLSTAVDVVGVTITGGVFGGIAAGGSLTRLTLIDTVVSGNSGPFFGGMLLEGVATLIRSTISGNSTGFPYYGGGAGGIFMTSSSSLLRLHNSTVSENVFEGSCGPCSCGRGGCYACEAAAVSGFGTVELSYSTVADNECVGASSFQIVTQGPIGARGSVLSSQAGMNCGVSYGYGSGGHNLDSDGSCGFVDPTDQNNVDPLLGPLQDNGGPTPTHALLSGSPALNAISTADCTWDDDADPLTPEVPLTEDQRGISRPRGSGCDIGAFERAPSSGPTCGIGPELALLLPLVGWARRRARGRYA